VWLNEGLVVADLVHLSVEQKIALLAALERKKSNFSVTAPWTERHRLLWVALTEEVGQKQNDFIAEKDRPIWQR
jgi:hypothetical protein